MAETDSAEESQDLEAPEENLDSEHQALLHLSKYGEARRLLPWEQWSFREKANYCMDRIFFGFLVLFLVVLLGECLYKMWYVSNVNKVPEFAFDSLVSLFNWLFTQERQEELAEL